MSPRYDYDLGDELVGGLDEILGDELVGASLAPARAAQLRQSRQRLVHKVSASKDRNLVIPIDSVANVAASATLAITARPQTLFRPERLVVGDVTNFLINDIKVGKNSQFSASGSLPGSAFGPSAFGVRLKMDTCQVAMDIVISVTNTDGAAGHRFNAALFGASIE